MWPSSASRWITSGRNTTPFPGQRPCPHAHARGFKVAPWPVGVESRDDLRQLFRLDPELVVTNKPEVAVSILTGLGQWDESSKEG